MNDDDIAPGAATRVPEFHHPEPGPFAQFHQPTPTSPIIRRIPPGPIRFAIGAAVAASLVLLLAELL